MTDTENPFKISSVEELALMRARYLANKEDLSKEERRQMLQAVYDFARDYRVAAGAPGAKKKATKTTTMDLASLKDLWGTK